MVANYWLCYQNPSVLCDTDELEHIAVKSVQMKGAYAQVTV